MSGRFFYNFKYAFTLRKPLLLARLARNFVLAKVFSKKVLRYVDVCVSTQCNLSCAHCFATSFTSSSPLLSLDEWEDIAGQCNQLGCVSFGITGGEPLLYENLVPLVKRLRPERNLITINSNGTLLTDSMARALRKAGVDIFQFSMDSFNPEEHDSFRKKSGTHSSLLKAIDVALSNGLKVTLVCTVSHQTMRSEGVMGVVDFAKKRGILLIFSRATAAGEWLGRRDILLTKEDQAFMYGLARRLPHVRTDMDTNFGAYGCSAASEKLYVTPTGEVIPCPFMHLSFGNTREDSITTIRDRMLSVPRLNCYSPTCHTGEDKDFIEKVLSKTFKERKLVDWKDCFPE